MRSRTNSRDSLEVSRQALHLCLGIGSRQARSNRLRECPHGGSKRSLAQLRWCHIVGSTVALVRPSLHKTRNLESIDDLAHSAHRDAKGNRELLHARRLL